MPWDVILLVPSLQVLLVNRHVEHLRTLLTENVTRLARAMMVLTIVSTGEMKKVSPETSLSELISQNSRSAKTRIGNFLAMV